MSISNAEKAQNLSRSIEESSKRTKELKTSLYSIISSSKGLKSLDISKIYTEQEKTQRLEELTKDMKSLEELDTKAKEHLSLSSKLCELSSDFGPLAKKSVYANKRLVRCMAEIAISKAYISAHINALQKISLSYNLETQAKTQAEKIVNQKIASAADSSFAKTAGKYKGDYFKMQALYSIHCSLKMAKTSEEVDEIMRKPEHVKDLQVLNEHKNIAIGDTKSYKAAMAYVKDLKSQLPQNEDALKKQVAQKTTELKSQLLNNEDTFKKQVPEGSSPNANTPNTPNKTASYRDTIKDMKHTQPPTYQTPKDTTPNQQNKKFDDDESKINRPRN